MEDTMQLENMTREQLVALVQAQQAQALRPVRLKVSDKGGISMYGINKQFPVTLYASQWERVLAEKENVLAFIEQNASMVSRKA